MHTELWTLSARPTASDAAVLMSLSRSSFNRLGKEPWKSLTVEVEKSFIEFRKPMLPSISWLFRATSDVTGAIWYTSTDIISPLKIPTANAILLNSEVLVYAAFDPICGVIMKASEATASEFSFIFLPRC